MLFEQEAGDQKNKHNQALLNEGGLALRRATSNGQINSVNVFGIHLHDRQFKVFPKGFA